MVVTIALLNVLSRVILLICRCKWMQYSASIRQTTQATADESPNAAVQCVF